MNKLQQLKEHVLQDPESKLEYDALSEEFKFIDMLLKMRTAAGLTQDELAHRMGTKKNSIIQLEKGSTNTSLLMLKKYAYACGFNIEFSTATVLNLALNQHRWANTQRQIYPQQLD